MTMRFASRALALACAVAVAACGAPPVEEARQVVPDVPDNPLVGKWNVVGVTPPGGSPYATAEPGLVIYGPDGYYSHAVVWGAEPRSRFADPNAATVEEKAAAFDRINFQTGRYELSGATLTYRTMVGKTPGGGHITYDYALDGDTLTLTVSEIVHSDGTAIRGPIGFVETLQRLP